MWLFLLHQCSDNFDSIPNNNDIILNSLWKYSYYIKYVVQIPWTHHISILEYEIHKQRMNEKLSERNNQYILWFGTTESKCEHITNMCPPFNYIHSFKMALSFCDRLGNLKLNKHFHTVQKLQPNLAYIFHAKNWWMKKKCTAIFDVPAKNAIFNNNKLNNRKWKKPIN